MIIDHINKLTMEGTTLKNWTLGKKLGSGACGDVYESFPIVPISKSPCSGYVIKISALPPNKSTKANKEKMRVADSLYAEYMIYQKIYGQKHFPVVPLKAYGEPNKYRFLVMERLGRTLGDMVKEQGPIDEATVARIGIQLLIPIEYMHSKNIIYVDMKPDNFMLNVGKENQVYCVDFGICESFMSAVTGKHKQQVFGTISGTPTFLSINCHKGSNASRRDTIEALLYVLIYMIKGTLPWEKATSDEEGANIKSSTPIKELCNGMNPIWEVMLTTTRAYEFEEKPDYHWLTDQLNDIAGDNNTPFDL